jgi:hypothetical protein
VTKKIIELVRRQLGVPQWNTPIVGKVNLLQWGFEMSTRTRRERLFEF